MLVAMSRAVVPVGQCNVNHGLQLLERKSTESFGSRPSRFARPHLLQIPRATELEKQSSSQTINN
jgi:hypothetical protein